MNIKFAILLHRLVRQNKADIESEISANCFDCNASKQNLEKHSQIIEILGITFFCFALWSDLRCFFMFLMQENPFLHNSHQAIASSQIFLQVSAKNFTYFTNHLISCLIFSFTDTSCSLLAILQLFKNFHIFMKIAFVIL